MKVLDAIARLGTRGLGKKWLRFVCRQRPEAVVRALSIQVPLLKSCVLPTGRDLGFEDCGFLFFLHSANRGVLRMDFDEAGYLFKIARSLAAPNIFEIGRLQGGTVLLLAIAADENARITSVDIEPWDDEELMRALADLGAHERVTLLTCDANSLDPLPETYDLILIDGDHRYEGVKKDFERWKTALKPGGHLLFHDAANARRFATGNPDVMRLVAEVSLTHADQLRRQPDVGSIVHFVRTQAPWE